MAVADISKSHDLSQTLPSTINIFVVAQEVTCGKKHYAPEPLQEAGAS